MKRMIYTVFAVLLCSCLSACGAGIAKVDGRPDTGVGTDKNAEEQTSDGTPLFEFLGGDTLEYARSFEEEMPAAVGYRFDGMSGGEFSYVCDPDFVRDVFSALSDIRVLDESGLFVTDNYIYYEFVMKDGSEWGVAFNGDNLDFDGNTYTVAGGDALDDYEFVGYQSNDIFAAYPDTAMREFGSCFYDLDVASAACSTDGGAPAEITDPELILRAIEAISYSEPYAMGSYPAGGADGVSDTPLRTVTFTLADGTEYTLEFAGRNAVIELPAPVGVQYYWLGEEIDPLFELF